MIIIYLHYTFMYLHVHLSIHLMFSLTFLVEVNKKYGTKNY